MAYSRLQTAETTQHYDHVLQVKSDSSVALPEGFLAAQGGYEHAGNDLIISGTNGQSVLLQDFFSQHPSGIEQGSGFIPFDLAAKLAGPQNPGEYAQATPTAVGEGIGQIETVEGVVTAVHADGTTETLQVGSAIFQGDVIRTASGASVGITFKDESSFSLDEGGEITLDEMVYDPDTQNGAFSSTLTSGVFSFVSGQIAKANPDAMSITTPVATIGIRGTHGLLKQILGGSLEAALLEEAGGITGELSLTNSGGTITLNQPNQFSAIISFTSVPGQPITLSSVQMTGSFGAKVLRVLNATREHAAQRIADEQAQAQGEGDAPPQGEGDVPPAGQGDGTGQGDVQVEVDAGTGSNVFIPETIPDLLYLKDKIIGIFNQVIEVITIARVDPPKTPKVIEAISNLDAYLIGTAANDTLTGSALKDGILGLAGADNIHGYAGSDVISGGSGADYIYGGAGNDFIHGDSPTGLNDFKDIFTYLSSDSGSDGADNIYGEAGDDIIYGGGGNDYLYGDGGEEGIYTGNDTINGGDGNDHIFGEDSNDLLYGDAGDDYISGGSGNDVIYGGAGIDTIYGNAGVDTIDGGTEVDTIYGGAGSDIITGGDGDDIIYGDSGKGSTDTGADTINGGNGADTIYGNDGSDVIYGDAGNDILYGDIGSSGNGDGNDTIYGGAGNDTLYGSGGADVLDGGADDDTFSETIDAYSDVYSGGTGTDTIDLSGNVGTINIALSFSAEGTGAITYSDTLSTSYGTDSFTGIEKVVFGGGADTVSIGVGLYATTLPTLDGGTGADILTLLGSSFDMTSGHGSANITNFETLNLGFNGNTALTIDSSFVSNTGITKINGNAGDTVDLTSLTWSQYAPDLQGYQLYHNSNGTNLYISDGVQVNVPMGQA